MSKFKECFHSNMKKTTNWLLTKKIKQRLKTKQSIKQDIKSIAIDKKSMLLSQKKPCLKCSCDGISKGKLTNDEIAIVVHTMNESLNRQVIRI